MLKKKKHPFTQKLRIIQLFEGDFNGGLKYILGRLLMQHLTKEEVIDTDVYGSVKGKTAIEALLNIQLICDHHRIWKKNLIMLYNDADGCFDRIPPMLAAVALRRVGVPKSITLAHSMIQRNMKHYVKTAFGVSRGFIQYSEHTKQVISNGIVVTLIGLIGGVGQGIGAIPII